MKKLLMMLFIATLLGHATAAQADLSLSTLSCQPTRDNCDFYQCLEDRVACGPKGYPIHFGGHMCNVYLQDQATSSPALQKWYPAVRECLQNVLLDLGPVNDCADLSHKAFQSHVGCYVQTGFCSLSWIDKLTVARLAGAAMLEPDSLKDVFDVQNICDHLGGGW